MDVFPMISILQILVESIVVKTSIAAKIAKKIFRLRYRNIRKGMPLRRIMRIRTFVFRKNGRKLYMLYQITR